MKNPYDHNPEEWAAKELARREKQFFKDEMKEYRLIVHVVSDEKKNDINEDALEDAMEEERAKDLDDERALARSKREKEMWR